LLLRPLAGAADAPVTDGDRWVAWPRPDGRVAVVDEATRAATVVALPSGCGTGAAPALRAVAGATIVWGCPDGSSVLLEDATTGKTFGGTQWYLALQAGEVVTAPPIARAASGSAFPCARTGPCVLCS
jgi:hypothetical protein